LGEPALKVVERLEGEIEDAPLTTGIQSDCAGLSLLLRTMLDVRLPSLCEASLSPAKNELSPFPMLLLSLGVRLLGSTAVTNGRLDQGLCLMAGLKEPLSLNDLRECWASSANEIVSFQNSFLEVVAGQRLIEPSVVHLFQKTFPGRRVALIAADASATVWPLARVVDSGANTGGTALNLLNTWEQATGISPSVVVGANSELHKFLNQEKVVVLENDELLSLHENGLTALKTAIAALGPPQFENPDLDITFAIVDCMLLRAWARWLRRFSSSSVKYLLESFIRRQGRILPDPHGLVIELQRGPLDVIIEMAGYLRDLENVPSLAGGRIKFRLRGT
jgi:hypothetical protein